jgi:hypothetical protein
MDYYEYEYIVDNLIAILKEKNEAEEKQSKTVGDTYNTSKIMNDARKSMPSTKTPSFNVANFPGIPSSLKI